MEEFPPNSRKAEDQTREPPKRVERVTSGKAVRRKVSLGKQFKHTFFGGDARTAVEYAWTDVAIPALQEMLLDALHSGFERIIYGDRVSSGPPRRPGPMQSALGHVAYNRMSPSPPRQLPGQNNVPSRRARARHDFGEIVLESRQEAEEVLDQMFDLISRYEEASLSDLYALTGIKAEHTDQKWGWTDLRGSSVGRVRGGGYLLNLPEPKPLG